LESTFSDAGLTCERHEFAPSGATPDASNESAPSVIATFGHGTRTLYFHGHYDVVPAQSADQFQPVQKEHFVFARGACDMKGGIVSMLYAIRALQQCRADLKGKIALTLVPDEETGGARGSAWLAAQKLLGRNGIGMPLAGADKRRRMERKPWRDFAASESSGQSAHVGLQHRGENSFEQMVPRRRAAAASQARVEQRQTTHVPGAEQNRNSILMLGGQSGGGANFNVVPSNPGSR